MNLIQKTFKILFWMVLFLFGMTTMHAIGTVKGIVITAPTPSCTVAYKTYTGIDMPTVNPVAVLSANAVAGVYGFNLGSVVTTNLAQATVTRSITAIGVTGNLYQSVTNISNDPTNIVFKFKGTSRVIQGNVGTLALWKFGIKQATLNVNIDSTTNNWKVTIWPSITARNASEAAITVNVSIPGAATLTRYKGFNQKYYGAYGSYDYLISAYVSGPDIQLVNRLLNVSTSGLVGYTGTAGAVVPGAKLTYTVVIKNNGSSTANAVAVADSIPVNTTFHSIPSGGNQDLVEYKNSGVWGSFISSANVQAIRFKKTSLSKATTATFNYSVTVN